MSYKIDWKEDRNLTLLVDFYELTMANGFLKSGVGNKIAYFDLYFRKVPDNGGFCIFAGLQQLIEYLKHISFSENDIKYLESKNLFDDEFIDYLREFNFECDVWAVHEGTPVFPNEPLVTVRGPVIQAQFIETMMLLTINHQTLIATKTNRIVRAALGRNVMEFGSRRAQGYDGAIFGARAAYIGGCSSTACTIAEKMFGVPAVGTMAHSWVQLFDSELESFRAWASAYPENSLLLVDTYNVLKSGVPNAIKVFKEELLPKGIKPLGIRIDSGDITYLTEKSREMLNENGLEDCQIVVSNSLDEYIIRDVLSQGAKIDSFGVGERLITSKSEPVLGGVYKLVALEDNGQIIPKIKISENPEKITTPGFKQVYRLFDKNTNKAIADLITFHDEVINENEPIEIFHPIYTWKRKKVENFYCKRLLNEVFVKGKCVYTSPSTKEIREYAKDEIDTLWDEVLRFDYPHKYYVDLSLNMWDMKHSLLKKHNLKFR
ncbi:MAG: nicotinate phosphoribosyltransferase [Clostridium sp.]